MKTCECGCGQPTRIARGTSLRDGTVRGEPLRFVHGHNARVSADGTSTPDAVSRFWSKVRSGTADECWLWLASTNHKQYGHIWIDGRYEQAHRFAYEIAVGSIPAGMHVDHLCRNQRCVNPGHLEPVTPQENSRRRRESEQQSLMQRSSS